MNTARFTRVALVLALSVVAVTGCAQTPVASGTPPSPVTPTATPTADVASAPAQVFGGDCTAVLSDSAASDIVGVPVTGVPVRFGSMPQVRALPSLGGLDCWWVPVDEAQTASLTATILPEAAVAEWATSSEVTCAPADSQFGCLSDVVDRGYWSSIYLVTADAASSDEAASATTAVLEAVATAVTAAGEPPVAVAGVTLDGAWVPQDDCDALRASVDAATLTAIPELTEGAFPQGAAEMQLSYAAAVTVAGASACLWTEPGDFEVSKTVLGVDFLPGGSWVAEEIAALPGAVELEPENLDRAILVSDPTDSDGGAVLHAFDGVNWLTVSGSDVDIDASFLRFAEEVVAAQNSN